jgi:quercetin dioxygenase-like cupin family protein
MNQGETESCRDIMIVRNINDKEVLDTTYLAHGGAVAQMILDRRSLKEIGFLAVAGLSPGQEIEGHRDPMEEIYFLMKGSGEMQVQGEIRQVNPGDAVWIPAGSMHSLRNNEDKECVVLMVASPAW